MRLSGSKPSIVYHVYLITLTLLGKGEGVGEGEGAVCDGGEVMWARDPVRRR